MTSRFFLCSSKILFLIILFVSLIIGSIRFFSVHRIYTIADLGEIVYLWRLPIVDSGNRCKEVQESLAYRCLPNLFVIGASKAGTTSFISYLLDYPKISLIRRRIHLIDKHSEIHRFDRSTFSSAYKSVELLHEWASSPLVTSVDDLVIHYTPHYLYAPTVPFDMRSFYPHLESNWQSNNRNSKIHFIILLRNPVDRMLSSYWFKNSHLFGSEDRGSLEDLIATFKTQRLARLQYERCMIEFYKKNKNEDQHEFRFSNFQNNQDNDSSWRDIVPLLHPYCTQFSSSEGEEKKVTCQYLFLIYRILQTVMDCTISYNPSHHPATIQTQHPSLGSNASSRFYRWESRCHRRKDLSREKHLLLLDQLRGALVTCYGRKKLRGKTLGLQHLDKSIYLDQLLRWWLNFPETRSFLLLSSEALFEETSLVMDQVYSTLQPQSLTRLEKETIMKRRGDSKSLSTKRLYRPNHHSHSSSLQSHPLYQNLLVEASSYFEIYQNFLFTVMLKKNTE